MRRLVHTSAGWMERWNEKYSEGGLADAIEAASLPRGEAEQLASSTLEVWRKSGREQEQKADSPRVLPVLVGTFGLAAVGVAAVVVAAVLLLF